MKQEFGGLNDCCVGCNNDNSHCGYSSEQWTASELSQVVKLSCDGTLNQVIFEE
jgi:hypothetical protein